MILYVKDENNQWQSIPALEGHSVYMAEAPTSFSSSSELPGGWSWAIMDTKMGTSYSMSVYNGINANDMTVDGIGAPTGSRDISLSAVKYITQSLTTDQRVQVRNNIEAMYAVESNSGFLEQVIAYSTIADKWIATEALASAADISALFS